MWEGRGEVCCTEWNRSADERFSPEKKRDQRRKKKERKKERKRRRRDGARRPVRTMIEVHVTYVRVLTRRCLPVPRVFCKRCGEREREKNRGRERNAGWKRASLSSLLPRGRHPPTPPLDVFLLESDDESA